MFFGFLICGGNYLGWWSIYPDTLNIFGAEAISLWVTGTGFILASLDRVERPKLATVKSEL